MKSYRDYINLMKKIPLSEHLKINRFILSIKDQKMQDKLCAKWYSLYLNKIHYKQTPPEDPDYTRIKLCKQRGENSPKDINKYNIEKFIVKASKIWGDNYATFAKLKWCYYFLDDSEDKSKLLDKLKEFLYKCHQEQPHFLYDFSTDEIKKTIYKEGVPIRT